MFILFVMFLVRVLFVLHWLWFQTKKIFHWGLRQAIWYAPDYIFCDKRFHYVVGVAHEAGKRTLVKMTCKLGFLIRMYGMRSERNWILHAKYVPVHELLIQFHDKSLMHCNLLEKQYYIEQNGVEVAAGRIMFGELRFPIEN